MSDSETLPRATSYESSSAMILIGGKSLKKTVRRRISAERRITEQAYSRSER